MLNKKLWTIYWKIIIFLVTISVVFYIYNPIPLIYNLLYGEKIIFEHIQELELNDYNCYEKFEILNNWLVTEIIDKNRNVINSNYVGPSYGKSIRIDGPYAAWIIKNKYGACGEGAWYLTAMLNKLGCQARTINKEGWSHAWTEFIDEEGVKYYAEPFVMADSNIMKFIETVKTYSVGYDDKLDKNICIWTDIDKKFFARKNQFNKKYITEEYYPYMSQFKYKTNNCKDG